VSLSSASMAEKPPIDGGWFVGAAALIGALAAAVVRVAPWLRRRALDHAAQARKDRADAVTHYEGLLLRLEQEAERTQKRFAALEERFAEAETERQRLMAINATQAAELTALQSQVASQRGQITYLTEENGRLCSKLEHLESENTALKAKVQTLERLERATHPDLPQGTPGERGERGETGERGDRGPRGERGATG
jgi:chromosome segregation ATPase